MMYTNKSTMIHRSRLRGNNNASLSRLLKDRQRSCNECKMKLISWRNRSRRLENGSKCQWKECKTNMLCLSNLRMKREVWSSLVIHLTVKPSNKRASPRISHTEWLQPEPSLKPLKNKEWRGNYKKEKEQWWTTKRWNRLRNKSIWKGDHLPTIRLNRSSHIRHRTAWTSIWLRSLQMRKLHDKNTFKECMKIIEMLMQVNSNQVILKKLGDRLLKK